MQSRRHGPRRLNDIQPLVPATEPVYLDSALVGRADNQTADAVTNFSPSKVGAIVGVVCFFTVIISGKLPLLL
jgi:hypothetical protein